MAGARRNRCGSARAARARAAWRHSAQRTVNMRPLARPRGSGSVCVAARRQGGEKVCVQLRAQRVACAVCKGAWVCVVVCAAGWCGVGQPTAPPNPPTGRCGREVAGERWAAGGVGKRAW